FQFDIDGDIFQRAYEFPQKAERIVAEEIDNLSNRLGISLRLGDVYRKWPLTPQESALLSRYLTANIVLHKTLGMTKAEPEQVKNRMLLIL
ncbi:MAG: hypothetical protein RMN25_14730, partial [Anaerolineae bacterium]|nr:hypothetical protein [Thermoflexales bacterium]MDW8409027.1 hypothetical protein [Anaerolineae bacterium]